MLVAYVTYQVPVEVEREIETGEIVNVHVMDERHYGQNAADRETTARR